MASSDASKDRAIITVLGGDRPGIVAAVCGLLAEHDVNILDISQTILQGTFTMTMLVDLSAADASFADLHSGTEALSGELGVQITLQREEVFKFMYRL
ncbi:MAG: ACT domain-containing protein [Atopobiaceae bacterium]|jgi:ACT domain-containing protein|nr:ACT domain-containing protein [Atopobiaceae bacterium]MCH4181070.1 ACT domain-containing protein [Atopobiaceae bacterium]MCH4213434.1 ACT domain-containing protein [Atopobiaceae bacterium]MCH4230469.1 ACT domain-containing protein [Atopobiaceae bacterium]MCH4277071.1 ACT domain-containing protein [Atopobiaceae bacterium]